LAINSYSRIYIFKTFFFNLISSSHKNYDKEIKYLQKYGINLKDYKKVLVPFLLKSNNEFEINGIWCMMSVNLEKYKIILYSSSKLDELIITNGKKAMDQVSKFFDYYFQFAQSDFDNIFYPQNKLMFNSEIKSINGTTTAKNSSIQITNHTTPNSKEFPKLEKDRDIDNLDKSFKSEESDDDESYLISDYNYSHNENSYIIFDDKYLYSNKWTFKFANTPKQENFNDGGIFICKFMDYISRNEPITFSSEDIYYFRVMISIELIEQMLF
jgi:Ulp1 family protease